MKRLLVLLVLLGHAAVAEPASQHPVAKLERSFWLNASLASPQLGYWGLEFPAVTRPTDKQIANAARVLCVPSGPNRLYLIYHHEMPVEDACAVFRAWRKACPPAVELVPTLLLRMYDKGAAEVLTSEEMAVLAAFFKKEINPRRAAVYDVLPKREQGAGLAVLGREFPEGLVRVGLQPGEALLPPFTAAVEDTWSGLCHGLGKEDWRAPGFGRDTLRKWVAERNSGPAPIVYDLIVVAWDYAHTKRGEYPGYDDANKNLPLPAGRNPLAATEILAAARPGRLAGFSSDLLILQLNSASTPHDGRRGSFYETLKAGQPYTGFYAAPWREVLGIFQALSQGRTIFATPEPESR